MAMAGAQAGEGHLRQALLGMLVLSISLGFLLHPAFALEPLESGDPLELGSSLSTTASEEITAVTEAQTAAGRGTVTPTTQAGAASSTVGMALWRSASAITTAAATASATKANAASRTRGGLAKEQIVMDSLSGTGIGAGGEEDLLAGAQAAAAAAAAAEAAAAEAGGEMDAGGVLGIGARAGARAEPAIGDTELSTEFDADQAPPEEQLKTLKLEKPSFRTKARAQGGNELAQNPAVVRENDPWGQILTEASDLVHNLKGHGQRSFGRRLLRA